MSESLADIKARAMRADNPGDLAQALVDYAEASRRATMSSGIWISAGSRHTPYLDEVEADCEVVDGGILARAAWYGVPAGQYHDVRIRARNWRRETTIDLEPALKGSTIRLEMTLTFPDEA